LVIVFTGGGANGFACNHQIDASLTLVVAATDEEAEVPVIDFEVFGRERTSVRIAGADTFAVTRVM